MKATHKKSTVPLIGFKSHTNSEWVRYGFKLNKDVIVQVAFTGVGKLIFSLMRWNTANIIELLDENITQQEIDNLCKYL